MDGAFFTWRLAFVVGIPWALSGWIYVGSAVYLVQTGAPNWRKLLSSKLGLESEYEKAAANINTHSEAIAAYGGEVMEESLLSSAFDKLCKQTDVMTTVQWSAEVLQDFMYKYLGASVAGVLIVAPFFGERAAYLAKLASPEGIKEGMDAGEATGQLLAKLRYVTGLIIAEMQAVGSLAGCVPRVMKLSSYANRVGEMQEILKELTVQVCASSLWSFSNFQR